MQIKIEYVIGFFVAYIIGSLLVYRIIIKKKNTQIGKGYWLADKHMELYILMNQWVRNYQQGKKIEQYFKSKEIYNIAIYGMSYIGQTLYDELKRTDIKVAYGIDKNYKNIYSNINVLPPDEVVDNVEAIVVTPITFFDEISASLRTKVSCPILNLYDILFEM